MTKMMTCKQMEGECDLPLFATTSKDMAEKMTAHVMDVHPKVAQKMASMTPEEHEEWEKEFHKNWEEAEEVDFEAGNTS